MFAPTTAARRGSACVLAAVLLTSACGAGRQAQTQNQVPSQDGTNANVGTIALRGVAVESPGSGAGYAPGSAMPMRLVLVNTGTSNDRLTNVVTSVARGWSGYATSAQASQAAGQQTASTTAGSTSPTSTSTSSPSSSGTPASGASSSSPASTGQTSVTVPAGQRVSFGVPDSERVLLLLSSIGRVRPGATVKITFTFARAGSVSANVPVQLAPDSSGESDNDS